MNSSRKESRFSSSNIHYSLLTAAEQRMDIETVWNSEQKLRSATGLLRPEANQVVEEFTIAINKKEASKKKNGGSPNKFPARNYFYDDVSIEA